MSENDPQSVVSDRTVGYTAEQQADQRDPDLLNAISLVLVSPGAWQVRDSRRTPGREGNLLGFVQERQGNFEVMQLADQFGGQYSQPWSWPWITSPTPTPP